MKIKKNECPLLPILSSKTICDVNNNLEILHRNNIIENNKDHRSAVRFETNYESLKDNGFQQYLEAADRRALSTFGEKTIPILDKCPEIQHHFSERHNCALNWRLVKEICLEFEGLFTSQCNQIESSLDQVRNFAESYAKISQSNDNEKKNEIKSLTLKYILSLSQKIEDFSVQIEYCERQVTKINGLINNCIGNTDADYRKVIDLIQLLGRRISVKHLEVGDALAEIENAKIQMDLGKKGIFLGILSTVLGILLWKMEGFAYFRTWLLFGGLFTLVISIVVFVWGIVYYKQAKRKKRKLETITIPQIKQMSAQARLVEIHLFTESLVLIQKFFYAVMSFLSHKITPIRKCFSDTLTSSLTTFRKKLQHDDLMISVSDAEKVLQGWKEIEKLIYGNR